MENKDRIILENLKKSYEIPVPDSAKSNILAGIHRAKKERKRYTVLRTIRNTGIGAAAAMLTLTIMVNTNETVANAMEDIPVIGRIAKVVTFRTYKNQTNNMEADVEIPKGEFGTTDSTALNVEIDRYAQTFITQYEEELSKNSEDGHYQLYSRYDIVTDNEHYLSIRIKTTVVMASGAEYIKIFTVDKATGEVVTLKQLFADKPDYIEIISSNIKQQMRSQMAADDSKLYFLDSEVPESDFDKINGDESYYFNNTGDLVISFDEYAVAPGYMGAVEFTIPQSVLNGES